MKSGKCVKCGNSPVYKRKSDCYRSYLAISFWGWTKMTDYICVSCGYLESYVDDKEKLEVIKNGWQKV